MNTLKVTIPLEALKKLVPGLPPGKFETAAKWENNVVLTYSSPEVNHLHPHPVALEQWLEQNPPKDAPASSEAAEAGPKEPSETPRLLGPKLEQWLKQTAPVPKPYRK